ncbi:serine/threonine-protein kinase [Mycobacterium sp. 1274761.0]|uniref:serine/threonine-protein kinase n=1 Tax=Mycobacterium sp. 1274761.0 TaxID=1834077 RepID=UPI0009ECFC24|nr:serine/threonine-protein kinase [Mycobacterium sp. 1274761.0]
MRAPEILGGRYELRGILGRGGMAEVRDGWDRRLDRPVAVKLLHPAFSVQPDSRARFESEARAAAGLNHPHIVAVHDSGEHDGTPYIVMERLSGRTLADELMRGPMPQARVRALLDDVLSALAAAHAAGILHRDVKPGNVLLTASGDVKVADFGIAKSAESPATMTGQVVGTMAYLSADRVAGRPATVADDLYAVGVIGYEALTGHKPFPQDNLVALARAIADDTPPPLSMVRPDVDPALVSVIERAMARDPQWRFPSADAMRAALFAVPHPISGRPPTMVMAEPLPPPATVAVAPVTAPNRNRRILFAAAGLFAIALAAVLILFETTSPSSTPKPATTNTSLPTTPTSSALPPPTSEPPPPPPPEQVEPAGPPGKKKGHGKKGD